MPTFSHEFTSAAGAKTTSTLDLAVREIEDAGVLEMLQTPGATLGTWRFLDALLDPAVPTFTFLEPLGHAREVKTAVSGLFGRFVARAYGTRHLGLTHFVHVRKPPMTLSGMFRGTLRRVPGKRGDMPDWVAWGPTAGMAIVEAKGCHDAKGPGAALERAYAQAGRAEIAVRGRRAPFKRYAIATRWGYTSPKPVAPMLWIMDPEEDGIIFDDERAGLEVAMARWHAATLLAPLGHAELARALIDLSLARYAGSESRARMVASDALSRTTPREVEVAREEAEEAGGLVGGLVGRAGPIGSEPAAEGDIETLRRLGLRPTFVGIEVGALKLAIEGAPPPRTEPAGVEAAAPAGPRRDASGTWIVRLDQDAARLRPMSAN